MNTTTVTFFGRETACFAQPLWQWDYGQILVIKGVELPESFEVHWTDKTSGTTTTTMGQTVDGVSSVEVPDVYLESGNTVFAYIYLHETEADGETEYKVTIPVLPRPRPVHETPTPVQQTEIEQLMAQLEAATERASKKLVCVITNSMSAEEQYNTAKTAIDDECEVIYKYIPEITFSLEAAFLRLAYKQKNPASASGWSGYHYSLVFRGVSPGDYSSDLTQRVIEVWTEPGHTGHEYGVVVTEENG